MFTWVITAATVAILLILVQILRRGKNSVYKRQCWWCSKITLLSHDQIVNGWYCSHCSGYNGFNEETGDYNKPIGKVPLQHKQFVVKEEQLTVPFAHRQKEDKYLNGLCPVCQAKMEENYNRSRLNDTPMKPITLCPNCDIKVENKIQQVDSSVSKMYPTGVKDLNVKSQTNTLHTVHRLLLIILVINLLGLFCLTFVKLQESTVLQFIQRILTTIMYTCCAAVLFTSLFIPKQGLLLPIMILAYYIGLKSSVTNLIMEQIVLVFSFLLAVVKAISGIKHATTRSVGKNDEVQERPQVPHEEEDQELNDIWNKANVSKQEILARNTNALLKNPIRPQTKRSSVVSFIKQVGIITICLFILIKFAIVPFLETYKTRPVQTIT